MIDHCFNRRWAYKNVEFVVPTLNAFIFYLCECVTNLIAISTSFNTI